MTETNDIVVAQSARAAELAGYDQEVVPGSLAFALHRRWRMMLFVTLIMGTLSGLAIWFLVHPKYGVSALVHVAPVVRPILFSDAETDISRQYRAYVATEAQAMASPTVIVATLNTPEVRSLPSVRRASNPEKDLAASLKVEHVSGTHTLQVSMVGENADDMAVIVNSLLKTYLRQRRDKKREWDEKILSSLRREQTALETRLETKSVELRQLGVENGLGTAEGSETAIDAWVAELQQRLTDARQKRALAAAKLEALDAGDGADALSELTPDGFAGYLQNNSEWQDTRGQLRSLESAALDDERLGRGPEHPEVRGRSERIAMFRAALAMRESELRDLYEASMRRRLEVERLDADITAKVFREALDELAQQRVKIAGQVFVLEDVRHERERLEHELAQVRQKVWNVDVEQNRMARVTIDSPALAPKTPNIDKRLKYTAAACLMSLFLGAGAALVRHRLDTSVRDPTEVTKQLGMSLLGTVQYVRSTNGLGVVWDDRMREPVRGISTALLALPRSGHSRSRLITSPTARSGKSSLALNLARSLASTGRHVMLVDADNRGQGVTRALEMAGRPGLKELLEGTRGPEEAVHPSDAENLQIIPAGQRDEQFGEILGRQRAQDSVRSLFEAYDEVIVDSPPVLSGSDAVVLATLVDEVILVLRAGESTREEAQAARQYLATIGDKLVGVILNAVNPKSSPYSYYGYAYADGRDRRDT